MDINTVFKTNTGRYRNSWARMPGT